MELIFGIWQVWGGAWAFSLDALNALNFASGEFTIFRHRLIFECEGREVL
jgi:hypothetical protein